MLQSWLIEISGALGLLKGSDYLVDLSFDTLALQSLFLVPRSAL